MMENKPEVPHYDRGAVQPIDFMEGSFTEDEFRGYLKGNVVKYVSRYRYKGTPEADLTKAAVYLGWLRDFEARLAVAEAMNR